MRAKLLTGIILTMIMYGCKVPTVGFLQITVGTHIEGLQSKLGVTHTYSI